MKSTTRQPQDGRIQIQDRLKKAASKAQPAELPDELPPFPVYQDPVARFRRALEAAGGTFFDVRESGSLESALGSVLVQCRSDEIIWEQASMLEKHSIPFRCSCQVDPAEPVRTAHPGRRLQLPLEIGRWSGGREALSQVRLAASSAGLGIAETGSLVLESGPGRGRLFASLAPCQLLLLSQADLLQNHREFFESAAMGQRGSCALMVTGPSRTADIEKTLVIGVHGPKRSFVLLSA